MLLSSPRMWLTSSVPHASPYYVFGAGPCWAFIEDPARKLDSSLYSNAVACYAYTWSSHLVQCNTDPYAYNLVGNWSTQYKNTNFTDLFKAMQTWAVAPEDSFRRVCYSECQAASRHKRVAMPSTLNVRLVTKLPWLTHTIFVSTSFPGAPLSQHPEPMVPVITDSLADRFDCCWLLCCLQRSVQTSHALRRHTATLQQSHAKVGSTATLSAFTAH